MYAIFFKTYNDSILYFLISITILNTILLIISLNRLYVVKASSSFQCLDTRHATSSFITEALRLTTYVQPCYTLVKLN